MALMTAWSPMNACTVGLEVAVVVLIETFAKSARPSRLSDGDTFAVAVADIVIPPALAVTSVGFDAEPEPGVPGPMYDSTVLVSDAISVTPLPPNAEMPVELKLTIGELVPAAASVMLATVTWARSAMYARVREVVRAVRP